jgi:hypothetical protein
MKIRRKDLFLDANQGDTVSGKAFGFVGANNTDEYQGWFFTWPSDEARVETMEEKERVLESLEADGICSHYRRIPYRWAVWKLNRYMAEAFSL